MSATDQFWLDGLPLSVDSATDTGLVYWMDGLPISGVTSTIIPPGHGKSHAPGGHGGVGGKKSYGPTLFNVWDAINVFGA